MSVVTCRFCGLAADSEQSRVVHGGTRQCVDSSACQVRCLLETNEKLEARVKKLQLKVLSLLGEAREHKLQLRTVAERQREACAKVAEETSPEANRFGVAEAIREAPLVTGEK